MIITSQVKLNEGPMESLTELFCDVDDPKPVRRLHPPGLTERDCLVA